MLDYSCAQLTTVILTRLLSAAITVLCWCVGMVPTTLMLRSVLALFSFLITVFFCKLGFVSSFNNGNIVDVSIANF